MAAVRSTVVCSTWRFPPRLNLGRRNFSVSMNCRASYGFIGLGQMGYQMAKNLHAKLPANDTLYIHDIIPETMTKFQAEIKTLNKSQAEVKIANRVRDVAESEAETIITVLPEPSHVKNVFSQLLQPETNTTSSPPIQKLFIDCSTIDPTSSREVARAVQTTQHGKFIDAPMSGGVIGATKGTLTFMTGCPTSLLPTITPTLQKMGTNIIHCGETVGSGLSAKLANNYLLAISNIATAEAMNLGIKSGLDAKVLANLINISTGRCWPSEVNNPVKGVVEGAPAERDYRGGFGVGLMRKDLRLAIGGGGGCGGEFGVGGEGGGYLWGGGRGGDV